VKKVLGKCRFT